jgi:hypothetical protein
VVVTVIVAVATVVGPLPATAVDEQLIPEPVGIPEQVKLTAVLNPVEVRKPTVVVPLPPGLAMVMGASPCTARKPG